MRTWTPLLLFFLAGCGPAAAPSPGAVGPVPDDPSLATITPTPAGLENLSLAGRLALKWLLGAERFASPTLGKGMTSPPVEVDSFRVLAREPCAAAAFLHLLRHGTIEGQCYALCGLWYADPAGFDREAARFQEEWGSNVVRVERGCEGSSPTVAALLDASGQYPAPVRLRDRKQTIREWCEGTDWSGTANPKGYTLDIMGGGWPASLLRQGDGK